MAGYGGRGLSGFIDGLALGTQAARSGADSALRQAAFALEAEKHQQAMLEQAMRRAAGVAETAMLDPNTGLLDPNRLASPQGRAAVNALLKNDPIFAKAFTAAFSQGSEAENQGFQRVPVELVPMRDATGAEVPGKLALRVQWRDKDGKVVSEGPMTLNGTNRDDDQVVALSGEDLASGFLGLVGAYSPELRNSLAKSWQARRDTSALKTVQGIQPSTETVVVQRAASPATGTGLRPTLAALLTQPVPSTASAAPDANAARAADEAAAAGMTQFERIMGGVPWTSDDVPPATREELRALGLSAAEIDARLGPAKAVVPTTVPPEQVPQARTEQPRLEAAARTSPAQAAPKIDSLQTVVKKRGAPKLNEEQKDALAWLAARKMITVEQYDRAMRTGRLSADDKKMLNDGLGGLWVKDEAGNISHIKGPYTDQLLAAKTGKGADPLVTADRQADFIKNHYGFLAMRPGAKGGAEHLDSARFNQVRDNLLVSAHSLGFNPYTPEAVTMVSKAKQLQDAWAQENGPRWPNLWLKDKKQFNSYTPGIIAVKFGKDMDAVMNQYYAPLQVLLGDKANTASGQLMDGFAQVVAGLEARGVPYQEAVKAATLVAQQGYLRAFANPQQMIELALQDGN